MHPSFASNASVHISGHVQTVHSCDAISGYLTLQRAISSLLEETYRSKSVALGSVKFRPALSQLAGALTCYYTCGLRPMDMLVALSQIHSSLQSLQLSGAYHHVGLFLSHSYSFEVPVQPHHLLSGDRELVHSLFSNQHGWHCAVVPVFRVVTETEVSVQTANASVRLSHSSLADDDESQHNVVESGIETAIFAANPTDVVLLAGAHVAPSMGSRHIAWVDAFPSAGQLLHEVEYDEETNPGAHFEPQTFIQRNIEVYFHHALIVQLPLITKKI